MSETKGVLFIVLLCLAAGILGAVASWVWIGAPRVEIERQRTTGAIARIEERERALVGLGRAFGDLEGRKRELDSALRDANRSLDDARRQAIDGNRKIETLSRELERRETALRGVVGDIGPIIDGIRTDTDQKRKLDNGLRLAIDLVRKIQGIIGQ